MVKLGGPMAAAMLDMAHDLSLRNRFEAVPSRYRQQSLDNLKSFYGYKDLRAWLLSLPEEIEQAELKCVAFLFAFLPPVDYGALTVSVIREHVEFALRVRTEASWREQLTDELFYHYILPHRVSQEPCQAWRKLMHDELWPRVKDLPMQEAALEANRYAREYATFQSTNGRDQGPLTTMLRGVGRCEEEMILYICAARSVGIPARTCSTPYWTYTDNNHAWCEAFADGRWWFLGGCEPEPELDRGWFAGPASRAGLVVSSAYGDVVDSAEPILARRTGVTFINSTPVYGDTCEVRAFCQTEFASEVFVHIFNFGSLRVLGRFPASGSIVLGRGDFVLTAMSKAGPVAALVRTWDESSDEAMVRPKAECMLDAADWEKFVCGASGHQWLRFPTGPRKHAGSRGIVQATGPALTAAQKEELWSKHRQRLTARNQWRAERSRLTPEDEKFIDGLPGDYPERARKQLARCGANTPEIMKGVRVAPMNRPQQGIDLLECLDEKDVFELSGLCLLAHMDFAEDGWKRWHSEVPSAADPEFKIWRDYVLNPRVRSEPGNWDRSRLWLSQTAPRSASECALVVNRAIAKTYKKVDRVYFGNPAGAPSADLAARATFEDASVCMAQVCRANGIPARLASGFQWAEVYIDGKWLPAYPFEPENFGKVREADAKGVYAPQGRINLTLTRDGGSFDDAEAWRDFMLCRVSKGFIEPVEEDWDADGAGPTISVAPGEYLLFTGARSGRGDVCYRSQKVVVQSNMTVEAKADCTLVREELAASELLQKKLNGWPQTKLERAGKLFSLQEVVAEKPTLLVLLNTNDEPARRLLQALAPLQSELAQRGINLAGIYVGQEGREEYEKWATELGVTMDVYDDANKELFKEIGALTQPTVILLTSDGNTLLWNEGYATHVPQLVKAALKQLK